MVDPVQQPIYGVVQPSHGYYTPEPPREEQVREEQVVETAVEFEYTTQDIERSIRTERPPEPKPAPPPPPKESVRETEYREEEIISEEEEQQHLDTYA